MKLLVIIPAYNEAVVIGKVIHAIRSTDFGIDVDVDVLVIDDGSIDNTAIEARAAGARTITLVQNLGYGYALQTGYRIALEEKYDIVVQMDGDGQHDPASIPHLITPIWESKADVVIGSRALSNVYYPMPFARRMGQSLFTYILYKMSGLIIRDPTSGFQALTPVALRLYVTDDFPGDYPDANVLLYLKLNNIRILEAAATFRINDRGTSMHNGILKPIYYIYKMTFSMLLVWSRHAKNRKKVNHE